MKLRQIALYTVWILFFLYIPNAHAQFANENLYTNIALSPSYPEPLDVVTAKLDAYALDLSGARVSWFVDGIEILEARNTYEVGFTAKDSGESTTVKADIQTANGQFFSVSKIVNPIRIDLIVESDSLVPLHYKGRALPSNGSTVRVVAIPVTNTDVSTLGYRWTVDGKVLGGGTSIGKNTVSFESSSDQSVLVTVEVSNQNGRSIARKTTEVLFVQPEIYFYEDNPLRGLSRKMIANPYTLIGDEVTVRAEPYFMSSNIFSTNPYIEWKVNNTTIENPSEDPQTITLRKSGETGRFTVDFHIRNLDNLLQGAREEFVLTF